MELHCFFFDIFFVKLLQTQYFVVVVFLPSLQIWDKTFATLHEISADLATCGLLKGIYESSRLNWVSDTRWVSLQMTPVAKKVLSKMYLRPLKSKTNMKISGLT